MHLFSVAAVAALAFVSCFNAVAADNGKVVPAWDEDNNQPSLRVAQEEHSESEKNQDKSGEDRISPFESTYPRLYDSGVSPDLVRALIGDQQRIIWGYAQYVNYRRKMEENRENGV